MFNRDPPPGELVNDDACPPEPPQEEWVTDQAMFDWALTAVYAGRACRQAHEALKTWALNPPKQKGDSK